MKGVLAPPFYRAEKPLPVRRAEAKNVHLTRNTYALRTEINLGLSDNLPCKNDSYGFLFGCNRYGHWKEKFLVRLGWRGEAKPIERRQPKGGYALAYQPAPQSQPVKVTVEDNGLGICGFWIGVVSAVASVIQVIVIFVH